MTQYSLEEGALCGCFRRCLKELLQKIKKALRNQAGKYRYQRVSIIYLLCTKSSLCRCLRCLASNEKNFWFFIESHTSMWR